MVESNNENRHVARESRRTFLRSSSVAAIGSSLASDFATSRDVHAAGSDEIRIGLVGCGDRGAGAAFQALTADPQTRLVAVADAFPDRRGTGT